MMPPMDLRSQVLCVVALVLGAVLGVNAGRHGHNAARASASTSVADAASAPGAFNSKGKHGGVPGSREKSKPNGTGVSSPAGPTTTLNDVRLMLDQDFMHISTEEWLADFRRVVGGLPVTDLRAAMDLFWADWKMHKRAIVVGGAFDALISRWLDVAPQEMMAWAKNVDATPHERELLGFITFLKASEHADPRSTWKTFQALGGEAPGMALNFGIFADSFVEKTARKNPTMAAEIAGSQTDPAVAMKAITSVAKIWAGADVDAALRWVQSLPAGPPRDGAMADVLRELAGKDPKRALEMLHDGAAASPGMDTRDAIFSGIAKEHPDLIIGMIQRGEFRPDMQSEANQVAKEIATQNPDDMRRLMQQLPAGAVRDVFAKAVAQNIVDDEDFSGALKTIDQIGPGMERWAAMEQYGNARAKTSIPDTTAWLAALPPGFGRDAAIKGFVETAAKANPQMAADWGASISDSILRWHAVEGTFADWHRKAATAASTWLVESAKLSADEKARLMETVSKK